VQAHVVQPGQALPRLRAARARDGDLEAVARKRLDEIDDVSRDTSRQRLGGDQDFERPADIRRVLFAACEPGTLRQ
jgi:hypothetical protein